MNRNLIKMAVSVFAISKSQRVQFFRHCNTFSFTQNKIHVKTCLPYFNLYKHVQKSTDLKNATPNNLSINVQLFTCFVYVSQSLSRFGTSSSLVTPYSRILILENCFFFNIDMVEDSIQCQSILKNRKS